MTKRSTARATVPRAAESDDGSAPPVGRCIGLPDAHSGPAFSTLVGLALLAALGTGDIRDIALGPITQRKAASGMIGRLVAAMKGGF